jgi:hypothetical protein
MTTITELLNKKGQFVSFKTQKNLKVRKGQTPILKISEFVARIGVEYDNIKRVQEKRESGELPEENQGLPWGQWVKYPYLISHKDEFYIRCSKTNNGKQPPKVKYIRDGVEITRYDAMQAALASEFSDKADIDVFNIKVSSILEIK